MRILLVAATPMEIAPVVAGLGAGSARGPRLNRHTLADHQVDVLVTGVGMVATAAWCSRVLAQTPYDVALNFGVCGSFDRALEPGAVVHVVADRIAELGAEAGPSFLTIQELHLLEDDEPPFNGGELVNSAPPVNVALAQLPRVHGITVNTVHGNERSIRAVAQRFAPQVESMEGAAFMYACLTNGLSFAQVRAVSNVIETRNRDAWKLPEAIANLNRAALSIVEGA
jgi:futalosine hydrolase